jgi:hypothetical protein
MATGARRRGIELRRLAAALALSLWAGDPGFVQDVANPLLAQADEVVE